MKKETAVAAIIVVAVATFAGGYILGGYGGDTVAGDRPAAGDSNARFDSSILPIGEAPTRGPAGAPVTLVFFADFSSSSTAATADMIDEVASDERFANNIRLAVKALPGRGDEAQLAAAAAYYAAEHGQFFDGVYEGLRQNADSMDEATIHDVLESAGLNPDDFQQAVDDGRYAGLIEADVNLARSLGVGRAPAVIVNGRSLTGNDLNRGPLREAVFGEQEAASELGASADQIYSARVRENASPRAVVARRGPEEGEGGEVARREPPARERPAPPRQARAAAQPPSDDVERLRVPIGDAPVTGPDDALVTIVEFSDFHCPFCGRVVPTIEQIEDEYGDDVRVAFRQNPLPMHPDSPTAHEVALAAAAQGHFWDMHDRLFGDQRARAMSDYEGYAQEMGLDMDQFRAFVAEERGADQIAADQALARQVGARGTPHFFINGRRLRGAQPIESFRQVIDEELALARRMVNEEGVARTEVYDHLMEDAQEEATAERPQPEEPAVVEPPPVGDSPTRGPDDAPVTIYVFSEFQCPYCGRAQPTLAQIEEEYGDQVRWVFKSFPLPFHSNANLAAQAALAAHEQGHFWEYHDILFQNQQALSRADLERYAEQVGLDMNRFRDALDSGRFSDQVEQELAQGRSAGVSGTPTFLINGERVVGALPFERFQPVIQRHLQDD